MVRVEQDVVCGWMRIVLAAKKRGRTHYERLNGQMKKLVARQNLFQLPIAKLSERDLLRLPAEIDGVKK